MRVSSASRPRHAECAYLLDRAVKNPASSEDFARAALDVVRLALRPGYAAIVCRSGKKIFHCGDAALTADIDAVAEILSKAPRSILAHPQTIRRSEAAEVGLLSLERAMTAAALDLVYPIADDGALLGVIGVGPKSGRTVYSRDDLEFCDRIGARIVQVAAREALAVEAAGLRAAAVSSERLASVGRMAAGLAHEIRNPLVSIRTFTQLLPERHADEEFRSGFLDLTLAEIDRITTLVGEILSFSRPGEGAAGGDGEAASVDAAECVDRTCQLLRSHARSTGVALLVEVGESVPRAAIDEDKLRQVVINLVVNGIQACNGRGRVRVHVAADQNPSRTVIEVRDDGPGIEPSVLSRIFEPFFTTREEGTGLGLALVRRILDEAGASIDVSSTPGSGTAFRVVLAPALEVATGLDAATALRHRAAVIEDDDALPSLVLAETLS
ncbi:MAG TPA: ATP-binding protein [Candidatus Binatia bacterium]